jgi:hypothetical protein
VLSGHFSRFVVVERDRYLAGPIPRDGVPQAHHVHVLLLRGQQILEEWRGRSGGARSQPRSGCYRKGFAHAGVARGAWLQPPAGDGRGWPPQLRQPHLRAKREGD